MDVCIEAALFLTRSQAVLATQFNEFEKGWLISVYS